MFYDITIVCCARNDRESALKIVEFRNALFPANSGYFVPAIQCMPEHVSTEFARSPDDTYLAQNPVSDSTEVFTLATRIGRRGMLGPLDRH
jgi:hypothetical protein